MQSLIFLGDLLNRVAQNDLFDWSGRSKLVDCICNFVLFRPNIGQVILVTKLPCVKHWMYVLLGVCGSFSSFFCWCLISHVFLSLCCIVFVGGPIYRQWLKSCSWCSGILITELGSPWQNWLAFFSKLGMAMMNSSRIYGGYHLSIFVC